MSRLKVEDDLTIYTASDIKERLMAFVASGDDLEIDLSGVAEIDSAGLQLLILAKREAVLQHKQLGFVLHSRPVQEVMELANLSASFGDPLVLSGAERCAS